MPDLPLLPCPFCGKAMMLRGALWPAEGDRDAVIHAGPTDCPLYDFANDTFDGSIVEVWNRRAALSHQAARIAELIAADEVRVRDISRLTVERDASRAECEGLRAASIEDYYARQIEWSRKTFGPALRTGGVLDHIRKELKEIEADPHDLSEWVDVIILAMDGFWRHGGAASDLLPRLLAKQQKNMARTWPDWRTMSEDQAIEHDRSGETRATPSQKETGR